MQRGFPGDGIVKNLPANARETMSLTPGSGRSHGVGHGTPLQHSCLENSVDRGAWRATVLGAAESQTWLSDWAYKSPLSENIIPFTWTHSLEEICAAIRKQIVLLGSFICPNVQLNHTLSPFHIQKSSWIFSKETSKDCLKLSKLWLWKFYLGCWIFPKLHFQLEPHVAYTVSTKCSPLYNLNYMQPFLTK